jgi:CRISPR/Cas system CSM-associated protein Csm2 small subunit
MAKYQWFKMYSEAANDPKLNYLSDSQFRVWFRLLCLAAEQEERGSITEDRFILSLKVSNANEELLNSTLQFLEKLKIIKQEENTITFISFDKRQYDNPSAKPEEIRRRVKEYRERKKQECNDNVTSCNDNVTKVLQQETRVTDRLDKIRLDKNRIESEFEDLWKEYPKKEGKVKALQFYTKYRKEYTEEQFKTAIENYKKKIEKEKTDIQFIKMGSSFFNGCFIDYLPQCSAPPSIPGNGKKQEWEIQMEEDLNILGKEAFNL